MKKVSIQKQTYLVFHIIFFSFFAYLLIIISLTLYTEALRESYMAQNSQVSKIVELANELDLEIDAYIRSWSSDVLVSFQDNTDALEALVEETLRDYEMEQSSKDVLRRLSGYANYQQALLTQEITLDTLLYMQQAVQSQQTEAQILYIDVLDYTNARYNATISITNAVYITFWLIISTLLVVLAFLSRQRAKIFFQFIQIAEDKATQLAQKDWQTDDIVDSGFEEIDHITHSINVLKQEINTYVSELSEAYELKNKLAQQEIEHEKLNNLFIASQIDVLRSQLNPHFLFNALNIIGKTALLEQPDQAMELIESISKILRYSLETSDRQVMLEEEIEIIQHYIKLQHARFPDTLHTVISVEAYCNHIPIPSMLIQPIVENCFKHAFGNKETLAIHISVFIKNNTMQIVVLDDGVGTELEKIHQGIGISNTEKRLRLAYKQDNLMQITSKLNEFTRVALCIPLEE